MRIIRNNPNLSFPSTTYTKGKVLGMAPLRGDGGYVLPPPPLSSEDGAYAFMNYGSKHQGHAHRISGLTVGLGYITLIIRYNVTVGAGKWGS